MKTIETLEDFNSVKLQFQFKTNDDCIIRLYDNKSGVSLQTLVVNHPISFLRNLQDFCKSLNLPVSDVDIRLIGFISDNNGLVEVSECPSISPYIYFKKPEVVEETIKEN